MFDGFQAKSSQDDSRARMGGSMAAAVVLYGGLVTFAVATTTAATSKVVEHLTQVEFAPPPPPPPPPPPMAAAVEPLKEMRPKAKRKSLKPPDQVPKEKPRESEAPLAASEPSGPVDGFLNGVEGGTGTKEGALPPPALPPKAAPLIKPVADKNNPQPPYPAVAKRSEIEGVVVVAFDVLENGTVANAKIVSGPEQFHDSVLKTVARWRFNPAKRAGKPMRYRTSTSVRFQLDDA